MPTLNAYRARLLMKIYGADNREMMNITSLEREGGQLVIRGKIFGAMPLTAKLRPEEARAAYTAMARASARAAARTIVFPWARMLSLCALTVVAAVMF